MINTNSLQQSEASPIYTNRTGDRITSLAESWAKATTGQHHLNPSKSKINVRTFLNKTGDNTCLSHPNL